MLVRPLTMKSTKQLAHDVMYTTATYAGLGHHVIDTDCHTRNGSANGRVSRLSNVGFVVVVLVAVLSVCFILFFKQTSPYNRLKLL